MKIPGCGCCLGMLFGLALTIFILAAAAFGIYCWLNPEAHDHAVARAESGWSEIKRSGDDVLERVKDTRSKPNTMQK